MPIRPRILWGASPVTSENIRLEMEHLCDSINKILSNLGYTQTPQGAQIKARILALPDSKIPVQTIDGRVLAGKLNKASQKFASDIVFSTLDYDTVQWTAGYIQFADGARYTISSGNTGNMSTLTFIYFDPKVSTTVLQVTTDPTKIAKDDVALLADAKNAPSSDLAPFWVAYNSANLNINQLSVNYLSALSADMGSLTLGSIIVGSTNKLWLNSGADGNLRIGGSVYANAPFQVSAAGALTATGATIKSAGSGTRVELNSGGVYGNSMIWYNGSTLIFQAYTSSSQMILTAFANNLFFNSGTLFEFSGGGNIRIDDAGFDIFDAGLAAFTFRINAAGVVTSGTWQGTAIANAYVADLPTSKITSGTFADARIAASNVTQHQASLSIATSQITGGLTETITVKDGTGANMDLSFTNGSLISHS